MIRCEGQTCLGNSLPKRILIADDSVEVAETFRKILAEYGYSTAVAHTGTEAVLLAVTVQPHLALLNIDMPKMDGLEAAMRILSQQPTCKILLTSGEMKQAIQHYQAFTRSFGYEFEVLQKPFPINNLIRKISAVVGPPIQ